MQACARHAGTILTPGRGELLNTETAPQACGRYKKGVSHLTRLLCVPQGEFVSVSRLEAVYSGSSPLIHQMYIYGSGLRSYLLAVVIPSPGVAPHKGNVVLVLRRSLLRSLRLHARLSLSASD